MEFDLWIGDDERAQHSKHITEALLPFLKDLNQEQVMEKQLEAKIKGCPLSSDMECNFKFLLLASHLLWIDKEINSGVDIFCSF